MAYFKLFLTTVLFSSYLSLCVGDGFNTIISGDFMFAVSDFQLPFDDAIASCNSNDMTLLSVDTEAKDRLVVNAFYNEGSNVTLPGPQSWIAAREVGSEGIWFSVSSNEPLYYTRWFYDQPDDVENLSCAFVNTLSKGYWRDGNCSVPFYFVCEKSNF